MGTLLALLLGVAAAFFVLAMPIRMLETVTTFTRLSRLMVQAEPPISPNDRTLLSVLAGILTAGIGWVLVDWLVFGRAGMSTLIRTREDDYEDEDDDHFRPTDPLDLVTPMDAPAPEWPMPASGDARRPLSARTDIGDPPSAAPALDGFGSPLAGINPVPPPIGDILPGAGISAPPLPSNALPPLVLPTAPSPMSAQRSQAGPGQAPSSSWPPFDGPSNALPEATAPQPPEPRQAIPVSADVPPPAGLPSWMPAPGMRSDGQPVDPLPAAFYEDPATPDAEAVAVPEPVAPSPTPPDPFVPPSLSDVPPLAVQPFDPAPPVPAPPVRQPEPPVPLPIAQPVTPAPIATQPAPPPRPLPEPGFDRVRLEELLVRLEKGLQQRRAAAAAAAQAQAAPPQPEPQPQIRPEPPQAAPAPVAPIPEPEPIPVPVQEAPRAPAPVDVPSAPPPTAAPVLPLPVAANEPPAAGPLPYALGIQPPSVPAPAPASILPVAPPLVIPEGRNDELLDQPLHVTLDLLRSMVKR